MFNNLHNRAIMTNGGPIERGKKYNPLLANIFSHIARTHTTALSSSLKTDVSVPPKLHSVAT
jgi:hypothetical protein